MTTTTPAKTPIQKLNDGLIKAAIWDNPTDNGHFYTATIKNAFEKDGEFTDTSNYTPDELLKLARLALKTYDLIVERRQS